MINGKQLKAIAKVCDKSRYPDFVAARGNMLYATDTFCAVRVTLSEMICGEEPMKISPVVIKGTGSKEHLRKEALMMGAMECRYPKIDKMFDEAAANSYGQHMFSDAPRFDAALFLKIANVFDSFDARFDFWPGFKEGKPAYFRCSDDDIILEAILMPIRK